MYVNDATDREVVALPVNCGGPHRMKGLEQAVRMASSVWLAGQRVARLVGRPERGERER